ncbi:MAG: hypothetical protein K9N49_09715, partial [Candidatus Marinimicrobia bacterium]|nr:hypothetical protein [Candidatus Neomarinimicrobiota bacterium]
FGEWFLAAAGGYRLGEVIYEIIPGPFGREKLCAWGSGRGRDCPFERTGLRFGSPEPLPRPYGAGLRLHARDLPGSLRALTLELVTYDELPWLDICYRLDKAPNPEAEALYVAFPLAWKPECALVTDHRPDRQSPGEGGSPITVHLDCPGAVYRPGLDQVPGTATDWHSLQHYFAVENGERTVVVAAPDIPLVQINGLNTGKWQETLPPPNGLVMSWVMNNYWFTNFPAAQGGGFTWRYRLHVLPGGFDRQTADALARTVRQPLAAVALPWGPGRSHNRSTETQEARQ